jgi:L-2,4-diaminobutyric acid acetyltransferase
MISKSFFEKEDFINQHEEEVLYEIGPFKIKEKNENI